MSLSLDELIEIVLIETGQYIADLSATLLDKPKFSRMAARELAQYSRYKPETKTLLLELYNDKVFQGTDNEDIPHFISEIRRVNTGINMRQSSNLRVVSKSLYSYHNNILTFSLPKDDYLVIYGLNHSYDRSTETFNGVDSTSNQFISLVVAKFMIAVGRSRKAFTLQDLPITMDGDSMASDGTAMYEQALEGLRSNSKFYLAIG